MKQYDKGGWLWGICNYIKVVLSKPMAKLRELETFLASVGTAVGPSNVHGLRIPSITHVPCLTSRHDENMGQIVLDYECIFQKFRQWGEENTTLAAYSGS